MSDDPEGMRQDLLARVSIRRSSIDDFLARARPRGNRLVTVAVVSSAVAAALTAGPAIGGESFATGVADGLGLSDSSVVWRGLCLLALVISIVAAITTNLARSQDTERKIAAAESANAELEGLQTAVEFRQASIEDAVRQYRECVTKIPWVEERHAGPVPAGPPFPVGGPLGGPSPGGPRLGPPPGSGYPGARYGGGGPGPRGAAPGRPAPPD